VNAGLLFSSPPLHDHCYFFIVNSYSIQSREMIANKGCMHDAVANGTNQETEQQDEIQPAGIAGTILHRVSKCMPCL
jgi:hypothetical protein